MKPIDIDTLTMIHYACNKNYNTIIDYDNPFRPGIYGVIRIRINQKITSLKQIQLNALSSELKFNLYKSIQ